MAADTEQKTTYFDKNLTSMLLAKLNDQRQLSKFCDVVLKVCGEQIFAHSNILASASDYFGAFLGCGQDWPRAFSQKTPQIIEIYIDGTEGDGGGYGAAVKKVVEFMYTSKIEISYDILNQVTEIAKIMQMHKILEYCERFQTANITGVDYEEFDKTISKVTTGTMTDETFVRNYNDMADEDPMKILNEELQDAGEADDVVKDPDFEYKNIKVETSVGKRKKRGRPKKKLEEELNDGNLPLELNANMYNSDDEDLCIFYIDEEKDVQGLDIIMQTIDDGRPVCDKEPIEEVNKDRGKENKELVCSEIIKTEPTSPKTSRYSKRVRKAKERPDYITPDLKKVKKSEEDERDERELKYAIQNDDKATDQNVRFMCKKCDAIFQTFIDYSNHKKTDHKSSFNTNQEVMKKELKCDKCDFIATRHQDYREHYKSHLHTELICSFCEVQCESQEDFDQHVQKHSGMTPYFCVICDVRFKNRTQLNAHLPKHSEVKPFVCNTCNAGFKWKHALKSHMIVHSATKDHLCDICGFATAHKSMLKAHKLIHSGNTYKCDFINCRFQATKKQNLKYHMLTHSGEKPHQCEICGQSFSLVKNMKRHKLMHSSEKPLKCSIGGCQFATTRYDKLKEHKLKQHGSGIPPTKKLRLSDYPNLGENQQIIHIAESQITEALAATQNITEGQIIAVDNTAIIGHVQYAEIDSATGIIQYVTSITDS